ncbi:MAG: D-alanyl-D-alanine carboxypeptidase/D-alanyl-D-alanine-endopeptidase [Gaiellaceae bacterium]
MLLRIAATILVLCAALLAATPAGARPARLGPALTRALAVPHAGRTAALALDLESGRVLFRRNDRAALVPASNEKLAVAYAALVALGPTYRLETTVWGEGELVDGVWRGDLILKGCGDPTLSFGDLRWLGAQLRAGGVRSVTGAVVADESYFDKRRVAPGWKRQFYLDESPPLSALAVDRARYGGVVSPEPARAAGQAFRDALRAAGVRVRGRATTGRAGDEAFALASVASPPLSRIVRDMNRESDNFTAELLLKQLGVLNGRQGTSVRGAAVVRSTLTAAGVPLEGVRLVDGSGLSPYDRLTAGALVAILAAAWRDPEIRSTFVGSLPVAGRSGTLSSRLREPRIRGRVAAKTGTTRSASTLAGYVRGRYAFAVLHNGRPVSPYWARRAQDRFVAVLAAQ